MELITRCKTIQPLCCFIAFDYLNKESYLEKADFLNIGLLLHYKVLTMSSLSFHIFGIIFL